VGKTVGGRTIQSGHALHSIGEALHPDTTAQCTKLCNCKTAEALLLVLTYGLPMLHGMQLHGM